MYYFASLFVWYFHLLLAFPSWLRNILMVYGHFPGEITNVMNIFSKMYIFVAGRGTISEE